MLKSVIGGAVPENARCERTGMAEEMHLTFAQDWPLWFVLVLTAAVLATVLLFYRRAAGAVSKRYLALLVILRAVAMVALLLCLVRPVIGYRRGVIERSTLVVLTDISKSMAVHDFPGQPSRFERVRNLLLERDGAADRLDGTFDVRWHAFSEHARPIGKRRDLFDLSPEGDGTDLAASVKDALANAAADDVGGVILLTDGVDTTEVAPDAQLRKLGVPFYAVGVGSVLREQENFRDIMIDRVDVKRHVAVKTVAPVHVFVEAIGYPDRVVPVIVSEDGAETAREQIVLDNAVGAQKVTLKYEPQKKGDFELTIAIPTEPSERITENNSVTVPVFVGDPKVRVLYVEGVARSEYRELHRALQLDPSIESLCLVRVGPNVFLQHGSITDVHLEGTPKTYEELKQFKVLIIGSLDSTAFSNEQMEDIKRFVDEGGGLMMIGGEYSFGPGGYGGTPIEEALPVTCGGRNIGQERDPFPLTLTPAGQMHPIFAGIERFFPTQASGGAGEVIPDLLGCVRVQAAKPAAEVLAVNPRRRNEAGPLVAVAAGRYGSGRTMAATIDSTHLWYRPLRGMGKNSPYVRYWGQAARWLAGAEESRRATGPGVTAYLDKHFYDPGDAPVIRALVTGPEGAATEAAMVGALIRREGRSDASRAQLSFIQGTRNEYETQIEPPKPGKYEVVVSARLNGEELGEAEVSFRVGEPTKEFERLDLDEKTLRRIATTSDGIYLPLLSFDQLPEVLRARSEERIERREIFLWNSPILFLAFVLLATSEWVLRKRRLLS